MRCPFNYKLVTTSLCLGMALTVSVNGWALTSVSTKTQQPISINPAINIPVNPSSPFDDSDLLIGRQEIRSLIITVEFDDQVLLYHESVWADRLFSLDPDAKTVHHYFRAASNGKVSMTPAEETYGVDNDGVIGRVHINMNHPDTGVVPDTADSHAIIEAAIAGADPFIDFAAFDTDGNTLIDQSELAIFIVNAGFDATASTSSPSMRGHAIIQQPALISTADFSTPTVKNPSTDNIRVLGRAAMIGEVSGSDSGISAELHPTTLGLFVHEAGHSVFGLPDLRSTDGGISVGGNIESAGVEGFGLMGNGNKGMDVSVDSFSGETPVLPSAWSQLKLDWATVESNFQFEPLIAAGAPVTAVRQPKIGLATAGSINPVTGDVECSETSYFLVQYRTAEGYDRGLKGLVGLDGEDTSGVVIYHINEQFSNNDNPNFLLIDVEESIDTSVEQTAASPAQMWLNDGLPVPGGRQYVFDADSSPNSHFSLLAQASGVAITVDMPTSNSAGSSGVNMTIDSLCDDTGRTLVEF